MLCKGDRTASWDGGGEKKWWPDRGASKHADTNVGATCGGDRALLTWMEVGERGKDLSNPRHVRR